MPLPVAKVRLLAYLATDKIEVRSMQDRARKPRLATNLPLPPDEDQPVAQRLREEAAQWREVMDARRADSETLSPLDLKIRLF